MISTVAGVHNAASRGGTRDAADQEITDRVNAASEHNDKADRATEITESSATGDRNPDGRHPWDEFRRSNQHEFAGNHKDVPATQHDQTNDLLKASVYPISQTTKGRGIQSEPGRNGNQNNSINSSDLHKQQLDFSA